MAGWLCGCAGRAKAEDSACQAEWLIRTSEGVPDTGASMEGLRKHLRFVMGVLREGKGCVLVVKESE